ncbi:CidA/LrgA family protein [Alicyclobacillus kakegawensis]|uniref:CidA/LrgA family protein n=1 Tax=Alicyclobacillus kakegawensis TaxID=392012 RepID=UPI0009FB8391|nr:CidA/LrgA family protein [Alicyclobacillus kakegawensis]
MRIALRAATIGLQVAALWAIDGVSNLLVAYLHIPLPGSMVGCLLLFLLLSLRVVRLAWFEQGANWLLAQLLLFFVPSAVGVIQYRHLVWADGWRLFAVMAIGTLLVMGLSGLIAERVPHPAGLPVAGSAAESILAARSNSLRRSTPPTETAAKTPPEKEGRQP